jgi:predicted transcriptional regulator
MTAGELCNRNVIIICENESVLEAARPMKKYHVGCLVVVQELTDLAQLVSREQQRESES